MEPATKIPESNAATETGGVSNSASADYTPALVTLTSVFFIWGFMTVMNDILIPHLKSIFDLKYYQSMLVQTAFFGAYFVGSVVYFLISSRSGDPINKIGYMVLAALAAFLVIYINLEYLGPEGQTLISWPPAKVLSPKNLINFGLRMVQAQ